MAVSLVAVVLAVLVPTTTSAGFESTCSFDPGSARVDITSVGSDGLSRNGESIELLSTDCGEATVHNTDLIVVTISETSSRSEFALFLEPDGRFAPGATDEGPGSEIEIEVHFTDRSDEVLGVYAGTGGQRIAIDGQDIDLDADEETPEPDVFVSGLDDCEPDVSGCDILDVQTRDGRDRIDQRTHDEGTIVFLLAGSGDDVIQAQSSIVALTFADGQGGADEMRTDANARMRGGPGADLLVGGAGADGALHGDGGDDRVFGRGGADGVQGGGGHDLIVGGRRADILSGGLGGDRIWGGRGPDEISGDDGYDRCEPEPGRTLQEQGCEERLRLPPPSP
jgi:hypothetical protein